jgi:DNA adenine methylase
MPTPKRSNPFLELTSPGTGEAGLHLAAGNGLAFLRSYRFAGDELVYCDPPYLFETRSSGPLYSVEFGELDQHRALLDILTALPCMVMVSGYWARTNELASWYA